MIDLFPKDPKKIRARIRRYERALRKEYEETIRQLKTKK